MRFFQFLLLTIPALSSAQDTIHYVVSSTGENSQSASLQVSWTLGEVLTETFSSSNYIVNQGFQQGNLLIDRIDEDLSIDFLIRAYPNPVKDILLVETDKTDMVYRIIDVDGRVRLNGTIIPPTQKIDFTAMPAGTYFLKVEKYKTHKIIKH